ncbi:MAG: hypothetical protein HY426_04460, partial [Candidatus Levybacteria bacterium]|nr:hypothetical protein [Candidatus Levybacteria bacterium]
MKPFNIFIILSLIVIFGGYVFFKEGLNESIKKAKPGTSVISDVTLANDFSGAKVEPSDLIQGCFGGKDCIPSIDDPKFESVQ